MKKHDTDKAGISTGTTRIEPIEKGNLHEHNSTGKKQMPTKSKTESVSRGQRIKG